MVMHHNSNLLFSVSQRDCEWTFTKGSGPGGQKRNKTSNAVHVSHQPSGAKSYSEKYRSQTENKADAFFKLTQTPQFQAWLKLEINKTLGIEKQIEKSVEKQMNEKFIKIETKDHNGRWVENSQIND